MSKAVPFHFPLQSQAVHFLRHEDSGQRPGIEIFQAVFFPGIAGDEGKNPSGFIKNYKNPRAQSRRKNAKEMFKRT